MSINECKNTIFNPLLYLTPHSRDSEIFRFLNPLSNDQLSEMKPEDIRKMISLLDGYLLEYRNILGIDEDVRIQADIFTTPIKRKNGNSIEAKYSDNSWQCYVWDKYSMIYKLKSPVLSDCEESWNSLKQECSSLSAVSKISDGFGSTIEINASILGDRIIDYIDFMRFWACYENIIFRFTNGEFINTRSLRGKYGLPISRYFHILAGCNLDSITNLEDLYCKLLHYIDEETNDFSSGRYAVSFEDLLFDYEKQYSNKKNNILFQCPNPTLNPIVWQNNINTIVKIFLAIKKRGIDVERIESRLNRNNSRLSLIPVYNEIDLDQALEFVDFVFDNNFDKVYFLRQYFKGFELDNCATGLVRAKKFTE